MKRPKVYVQGGPNHSYRKITEQIFRDEDKYDITYDLQFSDIVVWTGGEDINPALYGEQPLPETWYNKKRDLDDVQAVEKSYDLKKFMVGICRGAQLLNCVPNGGTLWQDVDNHESTIHRTFDCCKGVWISTNSVHHQALRITDKAEVLAWAQESTTKKALGELWKAPHRNYLNSGGIVLEKDKDIEAVFYPETNCLLQQSHPEFGHSPTTAYFWQLMDTYYWGKQRIAA